MPLHTHADLMIRQLTSDNEHFLDMLNGKTCAAASSHAATGDADGKCGGKGDQGGVQKRGRWLPKMVKLIKAIQQKDWCKMYALTDEYLGDHMLKKLVEKERN